MWHKLARSYPPQFELIPLLLVALAFYIVLSAYPVLPVVVPTHFDIQGNPDGYSSKEVIFALPIVALVFFIILSISNIILAIIDNPKRLINIPKESKKALTQTKAKTFRISLNRSLFVLKVLIISLFTYITWQTVEIALGKGHSLGALFWLLIGGIIIAAGYMAWKSIRLSRS